MEVVINQEVGNQTKMTDPSIQLLIFFLSLKKMLNVCSIKAIIFT